MMSFITNWIEDKATGYLKTGIQAGGTLAGNAVGGVGSLIENAGKSAGQSVSGGIGGVGGYINGYGEGIKRSMSADGPIASGQKKTAVKSSAPVPKQGSAAQKSLPSTGGAQKALPAPSKKTASTPKPPAQASKTTGASNAARSLPNTKAASSTRSQSTGAALKSPTSSAKTGVNTNKPSAVKSDGKVRVSAASRPGAVGNRATGRTSSMPEARPKDPLGIGNDFANVNKTKPKNSENKSSGNQHTNTRKPTASDPLGMGDLENLGKKK